MIVSKWLQLGLAWLLALAVSALLVWSGRHWGTPLLEQPWAIANPERAAQLALALVLLPPAALALVVARGLWVDRGESSD